MITINVAHVAPIELLWHMLKFVVMIWGRISALLAFCEGINQWQSDSPYKEPVMQSFDCFSLST